MDKQRNYVRCMAQLWCPPLILTKNYCASGKPENMALMRGGGINVDCG